MTEPQPTNEPDARNEPDAAQGLPRWVVPLIIGVVLLVGSALVLNALSPSRAAQNAANSPGGNAAPVVQYQPPTQGQRIEPPGVINNVTLIDQDGEPLSLEDLQGKPTLIYFGYTFCPDICPTSLADMVRVKRNLGEQADEVNFVFISVDGERDTPAVIKRYLSNFDEDFIGLTEDPAQLRRMAPQFGVYFEKSEVGGTSAAYLIDHSAAIYLLDEQGRMHTVYGYGIPADVMTADVQAMLAEG